MNYEDFPLQTFDKIRYADTDRQGHVNNAVFSTFLETGRVELLYNPNNQLLIEGCSFVIASLALEFRKEIKWPGTVEIGTGITRVGKSSVEIYQELFQQEEQVASARTVIVQVSDNSGKGEPLTSNAIATLNRYSTSV